MATSSQLKKRVDRLSAKLQKAADTRDARIEKKTKQLRKKAGAKPKKRPTTRSHSSCTAEEDAADAQLTVAAQAAVDAEDALLQWEYEEAFYSYLFQVWWECTQS